MLVSSWNRNNGADQRISWHCSMQECSRQYFNLSQLNSGHRSRLNQKPLTMVTKWERWQFSNLSTWAILTVDKFDHLLYRTFVKWSLLWIMSDSIIRLCTPSHTHQLHTATALQQQLCNCNRKRWFNQSYHYTIHFLSQSCSSLSLISADQDDEFVSFW